MKLGLKRIDLARVGGVRTRRRTGQGNVGAQPPRSLRVVCPMISGNCFHEDARVVGQTGIAGHDLTSFVGKKSKSM